jgi:hypothetical protein
VRLVNSADTVRTIPIATRDTIAAAVRAIGDVMDKGEDVLILFMTSHGTRGGFVLQLPGRRWSNLRRGSSRRFLDSAGIQNRVVIVSACYSGSFVPPLANDNTIVITAADARNPSFGCAPGREWTFFGDAFFNRGAAARHRFAARLQRRTDHDQRVGAPDNLSPSNPQATFRTGGGRKACAAVCRAARRGTLDFDARSIAFRAGVHSGTIGCGLKLQSSNVSIPELSRRSLMLKKLLLPATNLN